ncbi:MAG: class I SAM-dependent methyltransferase [Candidatus Buchananbacteria bacterium]|nr:class I SAM-dependent methyltransferase [Candidatus Buchananbacteria bacterium]
MKKTNEELKKIILEKGLAGPAENERIYKKFFKDWPDKNSYIYNRFNLDFKAKILDIGCTYGHNLINFAKDSVGIEKNTQAAEFAKSLGLNVVDINAEDDLELIHEQFDLIWCTDFLVHMISPYKFLYDCRQLLKSDGRFVIQIPLMSFLNKHRAHCHFYAFNKKALVYLLEMAGYRVVKTSGLIRSLPVWLNHLMEPILQLWGGNIWLLLEKNEQIPVNLSKVYLPKWFKV